MLPENADGLLNRRVFLGLIILAGLVVYQNSLTGSLIFDDRACILRNPNLRSLWPLSTALSAPPELHPLARRPLVSLSLAVNYALGGFDVRGYHLLNLAIHLGTALVLFGLVRRTLRTPPFVGRFQTSADRLAWAVSLLWVVHPLNTQAVDVVIRRSELMMAFFYLLTLYGVVRAAESPSASFWKTAAVAFCALGMLSKEIMISAPLAALLYDRIFLASSFRELIRHRGRLHGWLMGTWVVLALLFLAQPHLEEVGFHFPELTFLDNLKTQCNVLARYLRLTFWPAPLVLDYHWPVARVPADFWPAAALLMTLLGGSLWALRRHAPAAFVGIFFFLVLAPTTLVPMPLEIAAEHRMYLPLAGLLAGWVVAGVAWKGRAALGMVLGTALLFGGMTVLRNQDYRTEISIWQDTVAKRPHNGNAHYNLGVAYLREQHWEQAAEAFRRALELSPSDHAAQFNLNYALSKLHSPK